MSDTGHVHLTRKGREGVTVDMAFDYCARLPVNCTEAVLLLHGYMERGSKIFDKLEPAFDSHVAVVSPNAPFLVPYKTEHGVKAGYSWNFYDFEKKRYVVDRTTSISYLKAGLQRLGLSKLPFRIIGFSQGGFMAPFLVEAGIDVRHTIGLGSRYVIEEMADVPKFQADAIHGSADLVVPEGPSRASFEALRAKGLKGTFHSVEGLDHRIDARVEQLVKTLCTSLPLR